MQSLPTVDLAGKRVTRLICGGNPLSGFSHFSAELDREMVAFYDMPAIQALWDECWRQGINTIQSRGDRHQMRAYLEHGQNGGQLQWIAQTASEFASIPNNIATIAGFGPIAIYNHGTHTDNSWHDGRIDQVRDLVNCIHDHGLPAGVGTHIPEVVEHIESAGWDVDFYLCSFYNLARGYKNAPATDRNAHAQDDFAPEDPARMTAVIRAATKPCIAIKILGAGRCCADSQTRRAAFQFALENIKPTDIIDVGMFQKHHNQVKENADLVRELLVPQASAAGPGA